MKCCENCEEKYLKDIAFNEKNPEFVYICGKTNKYLGYPEEIKDLNCEINKD